MVKPRHISEEQHCESTNMWNTVRLAGLLLLAHYQGKTCTDSLIAKVLLICVKTYRKKSKILIFTIISSVSPKPTTYHAELSSVDYF